MEPDTIYVHVEGDDVVYEFAGDDAEDRHRRWALDDEPTYDRASPA